MKLEIGKRYRTPRGIIEEIGGFTRKYKEWVWTIQGNWYRQSDGRYITYRKLQGDCMNAERKLEEMWIHEPADEPTGLDLIKEVSSDI